MQIPPALPYRGIARADCRGNEKGSYLVMRTVPGLRYLDLGAKKSMTSAIRIRSIAMKQPSFLDLLRALRTRHHWTLFQAVRYALWLTR